MLKHITKNVFFSLKLLKTNFINFCFYGLVCTKLILLTVFDQKIKKKIKTLCYPEILKILYGYGRF